MGNLLKYICISLIAWSFFATRAWSEQDSGQGYWVVGSFRNLPTATKEGARIVSETGIEAFYMQSTVNGVNYYRLLLPRQENLDEQARLALQMENAGIHHPWMIRATDSQVSRIAAAATATPAIAPATRAVTVAVASAPTPKIAPVQAAGDGSSWWVLGSYNDFESAQTLVEKVLGSLGFIAELQEFVVGSKSVIRVMAGPYQNGDELETARRDLKAAGYADVWSLPHTSLSAGTGSIDYPTSPTNQWPAGMTARSMAVPVKDNPEDQSTRESLAQPENTIRPGFNLATLRKRGD